MDLQHNNPGACVRFASHQFLTMDHFLCQGEKVIPCSLLNLQRKAVQMCLAYLSASLPLQPPWFCLQMKFLRGRGECRGLESPHAASFKLWGRADGSSQGFLLADFFVSLNKMWAMDVQDSSPGTLGAQWSSQVGSFWLGRGLVVAAFRVLMCSGVNLGEFY